MRSALGSYESLEQKRRRLGIEPAPERDLVHYLLGEYQAGEPLRLTTWAADAAGQQLSDRMVSRLEIANALRLLPYRLRRVVELRYLEDRPAGEVCRRLGIRESTLYKEQRTALKVLVDAIYEWSAA